ncbi:PLP-dependent aminotransferase family protein [Klebsiella sp. BIGb0407]|uniref:MocR-like pyridoxine biosynthesis transcription factor PdxR n=1 Tax=Klebsiella sp. BIGb0407 TaxID=2940603 RepID=UPI00216A8047|nr:PLP-dependent aminotransferase family protein [Klebsiella sp. BIGb0407]MCS3432407.1 GntR family transcriptional regulator/MocR family aminotransferase [Klebsiella sp. BIGb0407]
MFILPTLSPGLQQASQPRYQQIITQFKQAIDSGELTAGSRLPSSRTLAHELGLSRATIENAYSELVTLGLLERRGQAGTFVSAAAKVALKQQKMVPQKNQSGPQPFQMGLPALDLFPRAIWARLMGRRLRQQTQFCLALPETTGEQGLKQAITEYLRFSRGIDCQPEQVFITAGYQAAINLVLATLGKPGDGVWLEDPSYPIIHPVFSRAGMNLLPVPIDEDGMQIDYARAHHPEARFALVTPAHQSPLGVALSMPRRHALLEWASEQQSWVIEDDYDSEFRYHGKPLPALKSLDSLQRVIYAGTFSKTLFPALRTAWLVVPAQTIERFTQQSRYFPCTVPTLIQQTLTDFLQGGHFWRHLKKMRQSYAKRRVWLETALHEQGFLVKKQQGGIQMVIDIRSDDRALVARANKAGLAVDALSGWRLQHPGSGGLLLGFTNISSFKMAQDYVALLRKAIEETT